MKTYEEWCKRYDYYDPASQEAKDDYARYREQLEFFQSIPKDMKEYYKGMCLFDDQRQVWRWGIVAGPDRFHSKVIVSGESETEEVATETMLKKRQALNIELSEKTETVLKKLKVAKAKNEINAFDISVTDENKARRIAYCAGVYKCSPKSKYWNWWVEDHTRHNHDTSTADTYDEAIHSIARFIAFRHLQNQE